MKYVKVKNWEAYQAKNTPRWVKTWVDQLDPSKHKAFAALSDGAKLTLHHARMLAATCANRIPETWFNKDRLNMKTAPKIAELFDSQFLEYDNDSDIDYDTAISLSHSRGARTRASGVSDSSIQVNQVNHEVEFGEIWRAMLAAKIPVPVHKTLALKHFRASVTTAEDLAALKLALANYQASDRVKRGFVQDASTWFNNWREWFDMTPRPVAIQQSQTWFDANIERIRDFAGDSRAFEREFGFSLAEWTALGGEYTKAYRADMNIAPFGEWFKKRGAA